ncbi:hypothetical protein E2C01_036434 [Portunus trituberculatus]|uniref:Uncharacterized protein n=1 Tax=Portunus trituberculatus TaxID=210409 RepID=A0A5B7FCG1_PORTR|nr:hypothetical protein [Portunus trituberculatus]
MEDSKVEGYFTRMVSEWRRKPKLVVNIEISKNGDLRKRAVKLVQTAFSEGMTAFVMKQAERIWVELRAALIIENNVTGLNNVASNSTSVTDYIS